MSAMKPQMNPNEVVIKACESRHYNEVPARKGKLVLTNQRLFFWPHETGNNNRPFEIWPREISKLHFFNTMMLIPNGIKVITKDGRQNLFSVKQRNIWCRLINQMY